jgi:hypothetical protein
MVNLTGKLHNNCIFVWCVYYVFGIFVWTGVIELSRA